MQLSLKHLGTTLLLTTLLATPVLVQADHHENVDPTGSWTWTRQGREGADVTSTLKLKADGEKLTGKISGRGDAETDISNGKVAGNEISFDVTREFNGNSMTMKYAAKIEGDSLKGEWTVSRDGQDRSREWTATRAASGELAGDWKYSIARENGDTMDLVMSLEVDGEKVNGLVKVNEFEMPLEGTYKDGVFAYKMERDRDGTTWTTSFSGKVSGDKLTGKSTSNWNGTERVREIDATRVKK
jgi:hypothetical protein